MAFRRTKFSVTGGGVTLDVVTHTTSDVLSDTMAVRIIDAIGKYLQETDERRSPLLLNQLPDYYGKDAVSIHKLSIAIEKYGMRTQVELYLVPGKRVHPSAKFDIDAQVGSTIASYVSSLMTQVAHTAGQTPIAA